jgi:hypothetical protein
MANSLRAGYAVRVPALLGKAPVILFHTPPDQRKALLELLEAAQIEWTGKSLILCDCEVGSDVRARFVAKGASVAVAREIVLPGFLVIEGSGTALTVALKIARALRLKPIQLSMGCGDLFDAALTLGTSALTPLIDSAARFLRESGVRDLDAPRLASVLFQQTAREYAHSGKQSWAWHMKRPEPERVEAQLAEAGPELEPVIRQILLLGLESFDKHPEIAAELRRHQERPASKKAGARKVTIVAPQPPASDGASL